MALYNSFGKCNQLLARYLVMRLRSKFLKQFADHCEEQHTITQSTDVIDEFTTQLLTDKSNKWDMLRRRRKLNRLPEQDKVISVVDFGFSLNECSATEFGTLLQEAIETNNSAKVQAIVNECVSCKKLPSPLVLIQILSFYSQQGNKHAILNVIEACRELQPYTLSKNFNFKHYLARAVWIKGNISEAINLFEDIYRDHVQMRPKVSVMLRFLIQDTIINQSEASLVNVIKFAERLVKDFSDYYLLGCIWETCFQSEWFADQCKALELLETHDGLSEAIDGTIQTVVIKALNVHRLELVYRLFEVLLKLEKKSQYIDVLKALFDYQVRHGDLRACSEIIKWSLDQGVTLPSIQQEKFVKLLVTYKPTSQEIKNTSEQKITEIKYKF